MTLRPYKPRLWAESHHPANEASLVVAKKKIGEVREFLFQPNGRRLLVLKGPPGSGKASVLRSLCSEGFELVEWTSASRKGRQGGEDSLTEDFLRFLAQADRYGSLNDGEMQVLHRTPKAPRVSLVRDFPFTLIEKASGDTQRGAQDFLQRFAAMVVSGSISRAVLCFNDSREDTRIVNKLLLPVPASMVSQIIFDTVPRTFVQKALDRILLAEGLPISSVNTAALGAECGGDLRQAINALQLLVGGVSSASNAGAGSLRPVNGQKTRGKAKAATNIEVKVIDGADGLKSASLGLFHALGRFLYCKRLRPGAVQLENGAGLVGGGNVPPPAKRKKLTKEPGGTPEQLPYELLVPKATRPPLYYIPEDVLEKSQTDPKIFLDWILTNAPRFYGDVEDLANFATAFAECDAWAGGFRSSHEVEGFATEELAASVQVRSLVDANLHPIQPIRDPWTINDDDGGASAFNMVRPLLWDIQRHRVRRVEELNGHLHRLGPSAFGSQSISQSLLTTTLPFAHQMLCASRGQHVKLRFLPDPFLKLVSELSAGVDGQTLRSGVAELKNKAASSPVDMAAPIWGTALPDDPIEDL